MSESRLTILESISFVKVLQALSLVIESVGFESPLTHLNLVISLYLYTSRRHRISIIKHFSYVVLSFVIYLKRDCESMHIIVGTSIPRILLRVDLIAIAISNP